MEVDESTTLKTTATRAPGGDNVESSTVPGLRATTLGMRRKKGFKLKLEGISTRAKRRETNLGLEAPPTPGVQMLEMFENMMQARMDSCERLRLLVKGANTLENDS
jgi:hypothetical protein